MGTGASAHTPIKHLSHVTYFTEDLQGQGPCACFSLLSPFPVFFPQCCRWDQGREDIRHLVWSTTFPFPVAGLGPVSAWGASILSGFCPWWPGSFLAFYVSISIFSSSFPSLTTHCIFSWQRLGATSCYPAHFSLRHHTLL